MPPKPPVERLAQPLLLSKHAAAAYLGISERMIEEYIICGDLPTVQLPRPTGSKRANGEWIKRVLVAREDLDQLVRERAQKR